MDAIPTHIQRLDAAGALLGLTETAPTICPSVAAAAFASSGRDDAFDSDLDPNEPAAIKRFLRAFAAEAFAGEALPGARVRASKRLSARDLEKFKLGKFKQVCKYLFAANPGLTPHLAAVLSADENAVTAEATLERIERLVEAHWRAPTDVLVDAFSMRAGYERGMRDGGKAV